MDIVKECIKINEDTIAKLSTLDTSKVYLFEIDVDDKQLSIAEVITFISNLKAAMESKDIIGVYVPTINGINSINIKELSKYGEESDNVVQ